MEPIRLPLPHLSKSRYLSALQCDLRLYRDIHDRDSATPVSAATLHIFQMGTEVGRAAQKLFPNGVLVQTPASNPASSDPNNHAVAVQHTCNLMADESIPALFEAAFEFENVRIRVDILERLGTGRWGLREVKSASKVKRAKNLPDLAIQKWVLEGCGLTIHSAELIHVNGQFVLGEGEIDWQAYFERVELLPLLAGTEGEGFDGVVDVGARIKTMHEIVAESAAPIREPGAFCRRPHLCGYWEACTAAKSPSWKLAQMGTKAKKKAHMIEVTESGVPWFSDKLAQVLAAAAPPVWALDFEAIGPAIPFYPGTRPYQAVVFQWSLHRLATEGEAGKKGEGKGEPEHFEFLANGNVDPRPEVARTLVEVLGRDSAPILVYSHYEKTSLRNLAIRVPELAPQLQAIIARLVDLLPIVRAHVYHPDLLGSFSIKNVAPAFAPKVSYADLEGVAEGTAAMGTFARIVGGELSDAEEKALRKDLLAYCKLDTLALLELYRALVVAVN